ncbi:solute carrier family 25, member 30-like protein, partial [Ramicandelaber brevisporus]
GLSCAAASVITNPIDVIKIRLQIQGERTSSPSTATLVVRMVRGEGLSSLYTGLRAAILREVTYSSIRLGCYDKFKEMGSNALGVPHDSFSAKVVAGLIGGGLGSAIATPADVIKIRQQAPPPYPGAAPRYPKVFKGLADIYRNEGVVNGIYKGVWPTTFRAMILTASQLATYDTTKHKLIDSGLFTEGYLVQFVASIAAGLACSLTTSPIDSIRSRYMNAKPGTYKNMMDCLRQSIRNEGWRMPYKGFIPNWVRLAPHTMSSLIIFEQLRRLAGINPV